MRSGKYIKQLTGKSEYKAFIPNNLPFELKEDNVLRDVLSKADIALGRLDGIAETLPDINFFILMYIRKEATLSSQIEGTQATFSDLLKVESKIEGLEESNDVDEIINYISAMNYGIDRLNTFPLSLPLIKEIHSKLLTGVRGKEKNPGEFRNSQNWVGGTSVSNAVFIPPPVYEMRNALHEFEKFIHEKSPLPVLLKTGLIHFQFETIHPFLDGNGRIGRLLITLYLCLREILKKPLLYLSEFFRKHRTIYYDKLEAARVNDDIEGWLKFFLEGVKETSDNAVDSVRKIIDLTEKDRNKLISSGRKNEKGILLLRHLYKSPYITIKQTENILNIKNPNAISIISKFENLGILEEISGKKRYKVFLYKNYVDLFA